MKIIFEPKTAAQEQALLDLHAKWHTLGQQTTLVTQQQTTAVTIEELRSVLTKVSQAGMAAQVKEILTRHGAQNVKALDPKHFGAVMAEAEALQ